MDDRQGWVDSGSARGRDHGTHRKDPGEHYKRLEERYGSPFYTRIDAPANTEQKARLQKLSPGDVSATTLAGEPITSKLTTAPENDAPIDGLKVITASGWFAARPSGTEDIYKIYAESFKSAAHLQDVVSEAQRIVDQTLARCTSPADAAASWLTRS